MSQHVCVDCFQFGKHAECKKIDYNLLQVLQNVLFIYFDEVKKDNLNQLRKFLEKKLNSIDKVESTIEREVLIKLKNKFYNSTDKDKEILNVLIGSEKKHEFKETVVPVYDVAVVLNVLFKKIYKEAIPYHIEKLDHEIVDFETNLPFFFAFFMNDKMVHNGIVNELNSEFLSTVLRTIKKQILFALPKKLMKKELKGKDKFELIQGKINSIKNAKFRLKMFFYYKLEFTDKYVEGDYIHIGLNEKDERLQVLIKNKEKFSSLESFYRILSSRYYLIEEDIDNDNLVNQLVEFGEDLKQKEKEKGLIKEPGLPFI